MKDQKFKQFYLQKNEENSPFDFVGGEFILKSSLRTRDFVDGQSGFKLNAEGTGKISAFGGNVVLYDAVVDASGKGQFKSIQDALNAGKKRIFVRAGNYYITSPINITSGMAIIGEYLGLTRVINNGIESSSIFTIPNTASYLNLKNISFDGNSATSISAINDDTTLLYLNIDNCIFTRFTDIVLNIKPGRGKIINCLFSSNDGSANISCNGTAELSSFNWIMNNYINLSQDNMIGIQFSGYKSIVKNNVFIVSDDNTGMVAIKETGTADYNIISENILNGGTATIETVGANTIVANNIE